MNEEKGRVYRRRDEPVFGQPETCDELLHKYGTYEIQEIYSFIKFCHQQEIEWEDKSDVGRPKDNDTPKVSVEDMDDFMGGFM